LLGRDDGVRAMNEQLSWGELAELTHKTQVEKFNWCSCEDNEGQENPYNDCPSTDITTEIICGDCLYPMSECGHFKS
jgi:hypothetical protein